MFLVFLVQERRIPVLVDSAESVPFFCAISIHVLLASWEFEMPVLLGPTSAVAGSERRVMLLALSQQ